MHQRPDEEECCDQGRDAFRDLREEAVRVLQRGPEFPEAVGVGRTNAGATVRARASRGAGPGREALYGSNQRGTAGVMADARRASRRLSTMSRRSQAAPG